MRPMMFFLHSYNGNADLRFCSTVKNIDGVKQDECEKFFAGELERLISEGGTLTVNFKDGSHAMGYMLSAVVPY